MHVAFIPATNTIPPSAMLIFNSRAVCPKLGCWGKEMEKKCLVIYQLSYSLASAKLPTVHCSMLVP
jgi:hypothetical protein